MGRPIRIWVRLQTTQRSNSTRRDLPPATAVHSGGSRRQSHESSVEDRYERLIAPRFRSQKNEVVALAREEKAVQVVAEPQPPQLPLVVENQDCRRRQRPVAGALEHPQDGGSETFQPRRGQLEISGVGAPGHRVALRPGTKPAVLCLERRCREAEREGSKDADGQGSDHCRYHLGLKEGCCRVSWAVSHPSWYPAFARPESTWAAWRGVR